MRLTALVALALVALPAHSAPRPAASGQRSDGMRLFLVAREALENSRGAEARCLFNRAVAAEPDLAIGHAYLALLSDDDVRSREIELAGSLAARLSAVDRMEVEATIAAVQGDAERSLHLLREVAAARPADAHAQHALGERLLSLGHHGKAEALLAKATLLDPGYAPTWNFLGYALLGQRKFDEAIAAQRRYVELSGGHPNSHDSLGEALLEAGHLAEAEASFRQAVALDGDESVSWAALAQVLHLQGKVPEAHAVLETARGRICVERHFALEIQEIGLLLAEGDGEGALARLEILASRTGNDAKLARHLGLDRVQILLAMGRPERALGALESTPAEPVLRELLSDAGPEPWELRMQALRAQAHAEIGGSPDEDRRLALMFGLGRGQAGVDAFAESTRAYIAGADAIAHGDVEGAVRHMSQTRRDQWYFQTLYADALERAGRFAGALAVREDLVASPRRAPFYLAARRHALEQIPAR